VIPRCFKITIAFVVIVLTISGAVSFAGQANVFVYHRFGDSRYPSTNIGLDVFKEQLELLKQEQYEVLTLGDIAQRLKQGTPLPDKCAGITVDDGYKTFLSGAMPLLRQYGYKATLFVSTGSVGGKDYLDWDELRALAKDGIEIGNHSSGHPYLVDRRQGETDTQWRQRIAADIEKAQQAFQKELGRRPILFAYPYGEYSPAIKQMVQDAGFIGAAGQQSGVISDGGDLYTMPRFPMGGGFATVSGFREKLHMHPMPVKVLAPESPVLENSKPPELVVEIAGAEVDLTRLRCFVQGQADAAITAVPDSPGTYRIKASEPLAGRRNKYTLTAPGKKGGWYWFSQLWIVP